MDANQRSWLLWFQMIALVIDDHVTPTGHKTNRQSNLTKTRNKQLRTITTFAGGK